MRYQILLYMREIHVFMSPFLLIIYSHFFTVRITRSTILTLETCTTERRLTKSSSCCIETVFFLHFSCIMPYIFFYQYRRKKTRIRLIFIHGQPDSPSKHYFHLRFSCHAVSKTFLVDLLSAGKSARSTELLTLY